MTNEKLKRRKLGFAILQARAKKNMTQQELADLCKVGRITIIRIESGNLITKPRDTTIIKICEVLGIDAEKWI